MIPTEVAAEALVGNAVGVVATSLLPSAVLGLPATRAIPLPNGTLFTLLHTLHSLRGPIGLLLWLLRSLLISTSLLHMLLISVTLLVPVFILLLDALPLQFLLGRRPLLLLILLLISVLLSNPLLLSLPLLLPVRVILLLPILTLSLILS